MAKLNFKRRHDNQNTDIQHRDCQHNGFIWDTHYRGITSGMTSFSLECHYAKCHYAKCHYAKCHYAVLSVLCLLL